MQYLFYWLALEELKSLDMVSLARSTAKTLGKHLKNWLRVNSSKPFFALFCFFSAMKATGYVCSLSWRVRLKCT